MKTKNKSNAKYVQMLMLLVAISLLAYTAFADPSGTSITFNSTNPGGTQTAGNRSDAGGTITTLILDAVQQNTKWKAYLGNITGTLTLDDSNGNTIFDWSLAAAGITGEVYVTSATSITWGSIACATQGTIDTEHTALGILGNSVDSINATFNETTHPQIIVAGQTIGANSCGFAASTFVSDTREAQASATFPEVLLHDTTNLVYATPINQDSTSYDGASTADFQLIVADDPTVTDTTYYFYAEIGG